LPITRCTGFIIGYNLGILFYRFKKMNDKKQFWLIKRLQFKIYRIALPLIGLLSLAAIFYAFDSFEND